MPGASQKPVPAGGEPGTAADAGPATRILADRVASALVHHEPGWRLPRHTVLARRYNVSIGEIDAAIGELAARHILRRLPDGQLYRASPAEYLIPLEGAIGFARIDPMGGEIICRSRLVSWRRVPEDIGYSLGIAAGGSGCVIKSLWTADAEPAAAATTYLAAHLAARSAAVPDVVTLAPVKTLPLLQAPGPPAHEKEPAAGNGYLPGAISIEMQPPPPSIARNLGLSAGQPAILVTVRFDDPARGGPAAVTVAALRPELFRVVVETPAPPLRREGPNGPSAAWEHAAADPES